MRSGNREGSCGLVGRGPWEPDYPARRGLGVPGQELPSGRCLFSLERGRVDIEVSGPLDTDILHRLGDCLILALCGNARWIVVHFFRTDGVPPEALCLFESLGRYLTGQELACRVDIRGDAAILSDLAGAFRQGCSRNIEGDA